MFQTMTVLMGFYSHIYVYTNEGVWYLNPAQRSMKNPGQGLITGHFFVGLVVILSIFTMALLIKYGQYGSSFRWAHAMMGRYWVTPIMTVFLSLAILTELSLPGPIQQKFSR